MTTQPGSAPADEPIGGPNVKHAAAVAAAAELVDQLRTDIHAQTTELRKCLDILDAAVDTRHISGIGYQTPASQAARAAQDAEDRAAARGIATHSSRSMVTGLGWLAADRTAGSAVPGVHPAPVHMPAVNESAHAYAVLRHWARYISPGFVAGVARLVPGHRGRIPTGGPGPEATAVELLDWLDLLVDAWTDRTGLQALLRDLDALEHDIKEVTHGPATTAHPEPCPWCGRKSLVIHHRTTRRDRDQRDTAWIRCEGTHPCTCSDPWCPCQRHPVRHRHEWTASSGSHLSWRQLERDQQHRREQTILETKALHAIERIRALHTPRYTALGPDGGEEIRTHYVYVDEPPLDHQCIETGVDRCEDDVHSVPACIECRYITAEGEPGSALWPCPTYLATDLDQPDQPDNDDPQEY